MTGEMKVNPEKITITGAESKISQIKKAEAKINVDGLSKDTEVEAELVLYDAAENVISQSQLSNNLGCGSSSEKERSGTVQCVRRAGRGISLYGMHQ